MVISPLSVGETAILVFDSRGVQRDKIDIVVTSTDLDQFVKDLRFLFRDIEGLSTRRVGGKIVLEGEVYLKKDLDRIEEVLRGNDFVVNLVSLSQDTQRILARRIKNEINISGVEVDTARDRIILKGEVATEDEKDRAEKMALIYVGPDRLVNVIAVNPNRQGAKASKLIQVNAYFVEVNKSFLRNFNFSWTPIADVRSGWQYPPGGQQGISLLAILTNFLPKLNTAKAL
jgi:pilus assembly protein CpaC